MINAINIPAVGSRVGFVCGPSETARENAGIVLCHVTNR